MDHGIPGDHPKTCFRTDRLGQEPTVDYFSDSLQVKSVDLETPKDPSGQGKRDRSGGLPDTGTVLYPPVDPNGTEGTGRPVDQCPVQEDREVHQYSWFG